MEKRVHWIALSYQKYWKAIVKWICIMLSWWFFANIVFHWILGGYWRIWIWFLARLDKNWCPQQCRTIQHWCPHANKKAVCSAWTCANLQRCVWFGFSVNIMGSKSSPARISALLLWSYPCQKQNQYLQCS